MKEQTTPSMKQQEGTTHNSYSNDGLKGSIVVVAKCPIPGKSKTRLIPLLGEAGSVQLAKAMLSDVLKTIQGCDKLRGVRKILLYAPGTKDGMEIMKGVLEEIALKSEVQSSSNCEGLQRNHDDIAALDRESSWLLLPMASSYTGNDLRSNDLGAKLEDALVRVRGIPSLTKDGVVFLGMDAPSLPLEDIVEGLSRAANDGAATLCPAMDGGYAMLCVPPDADPLKTFSKMYWSHPLTGMSQIKALTDQGVHTVVGQVVMDVDEKDDVEELCTLLSTTEETTGTVLKNLQYSSGTAMARGTTSSHPVCHYTRIALKESGLLDKAESNYSE